MRSNVRHYEGLAVFENPKQMPLIRKQWEPDEWQRWVDQLLYAHYGHAAYQRVPDGNGGDWGIEGFSRDGCAYQCYVAEEPVAIAILHERQRDKINSDIRKFAENDSKLCRLFAGLKIKCWCLVVPRHESAPLLAYAADKSAEIRAMGLPYVADDFVIQICTDEAWSLEVARLTHAGVTQLSVDTMTLNDEQVDDWVGANEDLMRKLRRKAGLLSKSTAARDALMTSSVRAYILGQNAYETLQTDYAEVYSDIVRVKVALEEQLARECALNDGGAVITYRGIQGKLVARLSQDLNLSPQLVEQLADEALADWLLRCPLDFYEDDQDGIS